MVLVLSTSVLISRGAALKWGCVSTQKGVSISIKYFAYYINLAFRAADNLTHGSCLVSGVCSVEVFVVFVWLSGLSGEGGKLIILSPVRSNRLTPGPAACHVNHDFVATYNNSPLAVRADSKKKTEGQRITKHMSR